MLPSHLAAALRPGGDRTRLPVGLSLFALAVGTFGIGTTEFVIMGLLPQVAAGLGVTVPEAGHLISAYALGVVVGAPLLAGATVTFPRRTVLIALMGTFAIGNLLSALAPDMGERYLDTVYQTNWVQELYGTDVLESDELAALSQGGDHAPEPFVQLDRRAGHPLGTVRGVL